MMLLSLQNYAQNGPGNFNHQGPGNSYCKMIPNLTEEQQKKIDALHVRHVKEVTGIKNQIKLKEAELRILETAEKPDKAAIEKKIDEIMNLKTQLAKVGATHRLEVRSLLTDEQKVFFDARPGGKGSGCKGNYWGGGRGQCCPGPNPPQKN